MVAALCTVANWGPQEGSGAFVVGGASSLVVTTGSVADVVEEDRVPGRVAGRPSEAGSAAEVAHGMPGWKAGCRLAAGAADAGSGAVGVLAGGGPFEWGSALAAVAGAAAAGAAGSLCTVPQPVNSLCVTATAFSVTTCMTRMHVRTRDGTPTRYTAQSSADFRGDTVPTQPLLAGALRRRNAVLTGRAD